MSFLIAIFALHRRDYGPTHEIPDTPGYTFSDLTQRLLPTLILDAYPDRPVRFERAIEIIQAMKPTPRFREGKAA